DCGLLFNRRLARAVEEWSPRVPDGRTLARELIRQDLLTPYQANQLLLGKGQALVVGQYRLMERLGEGNLGQLFKAVHVAMDRLVTVRLLPPQLAADPVVRAQFNHIVHTLAQLNHPNILSAYDAFEVNGVAVLVMELAEGIDLARLVADAGPLPSELACHVLRLTALALQYAQERGLNCGHIMPSSILLTGYQPAWADATAPVTPSA